MDFTPATVPPTTTHPDPRTSWRHTHSPTLPDGQDHDRMETDEEERDSSSEDNLSNHQQQQYSSTNHDEAMDTTLDDPRDDRGSRHYFLGV